MGAGTAKPVRGPKDDLEVRRTGHPANNKGANHIAGDHKHGPECYTRKGLGSVWPGGIGKALWQEEEAIRAVNSQNLLTDNRLQEPSNQPSSSRRGQSTYLGTSTNVNVIPPTKVQLVEEVEEVEEDECPGPEGDIPDLEPKVSTRFDKAFQTITGKPEYSEAWKKDELTEAEVWELLYYVSYGSKQVEVMDDFEETYEKRNAEWLRLEQLRIDKARAARKAAELRAREEWWKQFEQAQKEVDENMKRWELRKKEEEEDLDTNTNTNNAQHIQANKKDEMVPEPDSATVHNSRPKELKLGVILPDTNDDRSIATLRLEKLRRIPPLYAARVRVLEERTKRLDERKKEEEKECRTILEFELSYVIRTAIFSACWPDYAGLWPELYAHVIGCYSCGASSDLDASISNDTHCLRHGQAIHENGETLEPDSTTVAYPGHLSVSPEERHALFDLLDELEKLLKEEKEMEEFKKAETRTFPQEEEEEEDEEEEEEEEEGDTDGSSSYGSSSDFDEFSDSDTNSLGHEQAVRESRETPKPNSITVPDPGRFQVTRKQRLFFRCLNELETRLKQEKELKKLKEAEKEEEEEDEEDEDEEDEDEEDEDWEGTDSSSSYGSSSDLDSPGHGQAITPKPDSTRVPDPRTAEQECCTTVPDTNVVGTSMTFPVKFIPGKTPPAWIFDWVRPLNKLLEELTEAEEEVKAFELKKEEVEVEEEEEIRNDNRVRALNEMGKKFKEGLDEVWEFMEKEGFMGRVISWDEYMLMKKKKKEEEEKEEEEEEEEDGEDEEEQEQDGEEDDEEDKEEGDEEEGEDPDGSSSCGASSDLNDMEVSSSDKDSPGHGQAIQEPRETHEPELDAVMVLASDATEPTSRHSVTLTTTIKDDTTEVITITELPADSGNSDPSNETSAGLEEDWESLIPNPWQWRNHPELVETQAGQEEDLTPRWQQVEKIAYHHKMPGWTYHHPSPAWSFDHYPQTGWTYYDPLPTWSHYNPSTDQISYYYPSPHLSVHHPSQTWYYYHATMGWTYCDHVRAWEFLHPAPYEPHVCPENSPDWTLYRVFRCPTAMI